MCACVLSCFSRVQLCVTPWTVVPQAPLSMGFSRQEYWSGLPCPSPEDLPNPGMESASLMSPAWQAGSLPLAPPGSQGPTSVKSAMQGPVLLVCSLLRCRHTPRKPPLLPSLSFGSTTWPSILTYPPSFFQKCHL